VRVPSKLLNAFELAFGHAPALVARAPGRINLLGEHVDYSDGWVLPAAIDRSAWLAVSPSSSSDVSIHALDSGERSRFNLTKLDTKLDIDGAPLADWARYPAGVAWSLIKEDLPVSGINGVLTSEVPIGAGLSSSAAVEVVFATAWQALSDWELRPMRTAQLCQRAENAYVGVRCGLMDQFSSVHGVKNHALYFDTRTLEWEPVRLPSDIVIVIADSSVRRRLGSSAYNQRRQACEQAARLLSERLPGIRALRDVSPEQLKEHDQALPPDLRPLAEHVVREIERVRHGVELLKDGDVKAFGRLMFEGHASLRDLFEVSSRELDALVEIAAGLPGCHGARLTGAGFGGCTVNLVTAKEAPAFCQRLAAKYAQITGQEASVWITRASEGAGVVNPLPD
jgi:galactokinase